MPTFAPMRAFLADISVPTTQIDLSTFGINQSSLFVKREDLLHPFVSGNKFRKLKYNMVEAKKNGQSTLLTFGGAFSNHIAATAAAAKEMGFKSIGIIRGEELEDKVAHNPTLTFAKQCGMTLHFISRDSYRQKETEEFMEKLRSKYDNFYLLPEGGTNVLAVKGCEEILSTETDKYDFICVSVGTGGTISGLVKASNSQQMVLGFSALKGTFQTGEISKFTSKTNFNIVDFYCFGGYGKIDIELIRFINKFKNTTQIPLDPVYTGKMMYGIVDLLKKGFFRENSRILAIHSGGLQGIAGMNELLKRKKLPLIE